MRSLWRRFFFRRKAIVKRARPVVAATIGVPVDAPGMLQPTQPVMSLAEIEDRFHRFVFSLPDRDADEPTAFELATLKRLELLSARFDIRSLPRLPSVLPQLLRMLKNDNVAGRQLTALVGRDPLMVGEVMRVTGSVHYRSVQPIRSLQHAILLLGQDGLRRVLIQHSMKPILQANTGTFGHVAGERLWDHAERCAYACALLGRSSGCDTFEAYLAGISCHSGTGAVIRLLNQLMPAPAAALSSGFLASCARLAAQLSLQAARYWDLPAPIIEALKERLNTEKSTAPSPLGAALSMADLLATVQLLSEHGRIDPQLDLSHCWSDSFAPALLSRCQRELHNQFPLEENALP